MAARVNPPVGWGSVDKFTVRSLVEDIRTGDLMLPEFQRSWAWDDSRIIRLAVSLLAQYPAGSLMLWDAKHGEVEIRPIDGAKAHTTTPRLILDGQQRLTAIWRLLYPEGEKLSRFYIDLSKLDHVLQVEHHAPYAEDIEPCIVKLSKRTGKKYSDRRFYSDEECKQLDLMPAEQLGPDGDPTEWVEDWSQKNDVDDRGRKKILRQFLAGFQSYEFPSIVLNKGISLEAVCNIFETVNSQGKPLSPFDLLTAKWYRTINLRQLWDETPAPVRQSLDDEPYPILQIHSLVHTGRNIIAGNDVTPSAKRGDLMKMPAAEVSERWPGVAEAIDRAAEGLRSNCGWSASSSLPYPALLNVLSAWNFLCGSMSVADKAKAQSLARRYYFSSVFTQDYEEGSTSKQGRDLRALVDSWHKSNLQTKGSERYDEEILREQFATEERSYRGVLGAALLLVSAAKAKDFYENAPVFRAKLHTLNDGVDIHHIFPREYLEAKGFKKEQFNVIANLTYLTASTNRSISSRAPSDYLQEVDPSNRRSILRSHLISKKAELALLSDRFDEFVTERATGLAQVASQLSDGKNIDEALMVLD